VFKRRFRIYRRNAFYELWYAANTFLDKIPSLSLQMNTKGTGVAAGSSVTAAVGLSKLPREVARKV
jgi:hypothetical protein